MDWIAQMVIGDWQFTYAMKAKSGLWGTARRQPRQYVGKRVCRKSFKTVIMGDQIVFQFTKESLFLRHG